MNKGIKNIYYNKRILLSESFDINFPIKSNFSESEDDSQSDKWLHSDIKPHLLFGSDHKGKDMTIDEDLSMIKLRTDEKHHHREFRSKTYHNCEAMISEDSISQIISDSFLDEIKSDDEEMNESERETDEEWNRHLRFLSHGQGRRATYQEPRRNKLEISCAPRYTEHDVYYIFQYHYIEHPIDWLFISEEPYMRYLVNDQQIIYANQTLSIIIDKMPEEEIMPWYFAFKGMISIFVAKFRTAYEYFWKAYNVEQNKLFLFWKIIAKYYIWIQSGTYEDYSDLKTLISNFEVLSQFNLNIKWISLKILLFEYCEFEQSEAYLNHAKDTALEIKSIDPYIGYIAWAEVYAATGDFKKCFDVLKDCIEAHPYWAQAYIRLYYFFEKVSKPINLFPVFLRMFYFVRETRNYVEKHCEIRYRLMSLLFTRVASIEGRTTQAINTIYKLYKEDGDNLSILLELARIVTDIGCIEYVGEAMGALEEIEKRGCNERNRDVYFIMAQVEILRGNIMSGYKLFIEVLSHLNPGHDDKRIDYINSFILPYKNNILKAIELEHLIENNVELTENQFKKVIKDLKHIKTVDKKYSDFLKIRLHSLVIKDPFEFMEMIEEVYNYRSNDIKLAIYYLDFAFKHKDLVKMTRLRDQVLLLAEGNENISTCEYVDAMDLIYRIYSFQGKFRQAIEILDRINILLPDLPRDYDLNRIRELIHWNRDETSENTDEYNNKAGPAAIFDFSYIEKLNITKLIMKDIHSDRQDRSLLSEKSPEKVQKVNKNNLTIEKENVLSHSNFDFSKELSLNEPYEIQIKNKEELAIEREADEKDLNGTVSNYIQILAYLCLIFILKNSVCKSAIFIYNLLFAFS